MADNVKKLSTLSFLSPQKIIIIALPLMSVLIVFYYLFTRDPVFIGGWQDILANTMPYHFLVNHPFALWNNAWITGFPEIAAPMSDRFYPFSFPIYLFSRDIYTINWVVIGHLFLAYITSYLLFSTIKKEYPIPNFLIPIFSLSYMLSGVILARVYAGHIFIVYALAWIPLLYYAYFEISRYSGKTIRNILLFSIASLFILFSASVYYLFFSYIFIAIFFLYDTYTKHDKGAFVTLFIAFCIFLLIGAIKIIPDITIQKWIIRQDFIDPLSNGGSFESNIASIIFGSPINKGYQVQGMVFGFHESIVLIGIILTFFIIMGFLLSERNWGIPVFISLCFALIWADGGKTLLSFIHLIPIFDSFRCPGRIFAAILPLLLMIGIQGFHLFQTEIKKSKRLLIQDQQRRRIEIGVLVIGAIKITEIFFQETLTNEALLSLLFLGLIIGVLYFNQGSFLTIGALLLIMLLINIIGISWNYPIFTRLSLLQTLLISGTLFGTVLLFDRSIMKDRISAVLAVILIAGITLSIVGNASYLAPNYLDLEKSSSREISDRLLMEDSHSEQVWVLTTGRPYNDIVLTYWLLKDGFHPMRAYYAYYLSNSVNYGYKIGNLSYLSSDYIVDSLSLENKKVNINNVSFVTANVSIYHSDGVLPNVLLIRDGVVYPVSIDTFKPDQVIVHGNFIPGDLIVLKYSYYPGWMAEGEKTIPIGNMIAYEVKYPKNEVQFSFTSLPFIFGSTLSIIGLCCAMILVIKRKDVEHMLNNSTVFNKQEKELRRPSLK